LFSDGFVSETLDTLTLLFPSTDTKTTRWVESECKTDIQQGIVDIALLTIGSFKASHSSRQLEHFQFWRERMEMLNEAVDKATPAREVAFKALRNYKQGDRWFNSWVAIIAISLTLFSRLVQSIEGAIQVYKAYHPTKR
jgi:hypothetical protein